MTTGFEAGFALLDPGNGLQSEILRLESPAGMRPERHQGALHKPAHSQEWLPVSHWGMSMKKWLRRMGTGFVLWAVPYLAAILLLPVHQSAPFVFKALEVSIGGVTMAALIVVYFRKIESDFLRESILLAVTWAVLNWALDIVALLPFTHQSLPQYFMEIGIEYAAFGTLVIAAGYLLSLKTKRTVHG
jgi:hypothetical protein